LPKRPVIHFKTDKLINWLLIHIPSKNVQNVQHFRCGWRLH